MSQQSIVITDDMCIAAAKAADPEWDINDPKDAEDLPEIREILAAVAPQIVAVELRRMAAAEKAECETWRQHMTACVPGSEAWRQYEVGHGRHLATMIALNRRADELDGGAR